MLRLLLLCAADSGQARVGVSHQLGKRCTVPQSTKFSQTRVIVKLQGAHSESLFRS